MFGLQVNRYNKRLVEAIPFEVQEFRSNVRRAVVFILHVKLPTGKHVLSLYCTFGGVGHCCYHCAGRN